MAQVSSDSVLGLVFSWPDHSMLTQLTLFDQLSIPVWLAEILTGLPASPSPGDSLLGLLLCLLP